MKEKCPICGGHTSRMSDIEVGPAHICEACQGTGYKLSNPLCARCDYGPKYGHSDECRGNYDPDEPCRNAEPEEYENE